jgi:hypothetical protein
VCGRLIFCSKLDLGSPPIFCGGKIGFGSQRGFDLLFLDLLTLICGPVIFDLSSCCIVEVKSLVFVLPH